MDKVDQRIDRLPQFPVEDAGWTWLENCTGNWSREKALDKLRELNPAYEWSLSGFAVYLFLVDDDSREVKSWRRCVGESIWYRPKEPR